MKTNKIARVMLSGLIAAMVLAGAARAQVPDTFTNLEVFPKDIGKRKLMGAMREFSTALGARCTFCHVQKVPGEFESFDWASDELEHKVVARGMMTMTRGLNSELLPAATGKPGGQVRCITCHRGLEDPRTLDVVLLDTIDQDGVEVGIARYLELRDEYYGSGSYDFSPSVLTGVAEMVAQGKGDMDGAMLILDLAADENPDDWATYLMRSQILIFQGDKEGAISNAKRVLELDPDNEQAQKILDQVDQ